MFQKSWFLTLFVFSALLNYSFPALSQFHGPLSQPTQWVFPSKIESKLFSACGGAGFHNPGTCRFIEENFLLPLGFLEYQERGPITENSELSLVNVRRFEEHQKEKWGIDLTESSPIKYPETQQIFEESHWIWLPKNQPIKRLIDGSQLPLKNRVMNDITMWEVHSNEAWIVPVETILVHCISYKKDLSKRDLTLYECRFELRDQNGDWKYAVYVPDSEGKTLYFTAYPENGTASLSILDANRNLFRLQLDTLTARDCVSCHSLEHNHGSVPLPCLFIPGTEIPNGAWVHRFKDRFGFAPFTPLH